MRSMPNFQPDYLISWDFNEPDCPCIHIIKLERDKDNGTWVQAEVIGHSYTKSGVVSLRQVLDEHEAEKRAEEKRKLDIERIKKTFGTKEEK